LSLSLAAWNYWFPRWFALKKIHWKQTKLVHPDVSRSYILPQNGQALARSVGGKEKAKSALTRARS
jgi:hypothetical protein